MWGVRVLDRELLFLGQCEESLGDIDDPGEVSIGDAVTFEVEEADLMGDAAQVRPERLGGRGVIGQAEVENWKLGECHGDSSLFPAL